MEVWTLSISDVYHNFEFVKPYKLVVISSDLEIRFFVWIIYKLDKSLLNVRVDYVSLVGHEGVVKSLCQPILISTIWLELN